jgi:hypothetical protein
MPLISVGKNVCAYFVRSQPSRPPPPPQPDVTQRPGSHTRGKRSVDMSHEFTAVQTRQSGHPLATQHSLAGKGPEGCARLQGRPHIWSVSDKTRLHGRPGDSRQRRPPSGTDRHLEDSRHEGPRRTLGTYCQRRSPGASMDDFPVSDGPPYSCSPDQCDTEVPKHCRPCSIDACSCCT